MSGKTPEYTCGVDRFFTEQELASRIADWAGINEGELWLEPSCGDGSFVKELLKRNARVRAVEVDLIISNKVNRDFKDDPNFIECINGDFMSFKMPDTLLSKPYKGALMNPPYGKRGNKKLGIEDSVGMAHDHVARALDFSERVIALLPASFIHGKQSEDLIFSRAHVTRKIELIRRPRFGGPDNKGVQARRDYCVFEFVNGTVLGKCNIETERW